LRLLIFILTICIVFSGCVEEKNATHSNVSAHQGPVNTTLENMSSTTLSSEEENIPEIEVTSFSSVYMHDNSKNVLTYLFSWDYVPGNESIKLSDYLMNDHGIDWVRNVQIIKTDDNNTIRVFTPNNSVELKLANDKKSVLITPNDIQLIVKEEENKFCIYKVEEYDGRDDPSGSIIGYNISEKHYAVYGLSIKNNGSNDLDFRLNELHVRDGDNIFNATTLDPYGFYDRSRLEVLSNLKKENKIENMTLHPGQTINGSVAFQVNSLYNESFLLIYNETLISSTSYEKNIKALRVAERFNYSTALNIPPFYDETFESALEGTPLFCNWINRSVFEFINKADLERTMSSSPSSIDGIHWTRIVYALKVIPERNITMLPEKNRQSDTNSLLVVDDTGEELINTSRFVEIAILKNESYKLYSRESSGVPQMNLSNVTFVRTSFECLHGYPMCVYASMNNQDVLLDDNLNIIVVVYDTMGYHFV
jgi:hypothetical protein